MHSEDRTGWVCVLSYLGLCLSKTDKIVKKETQNTKFLATRVKRRQGTRGQ